MCKAIVPGRAFTTRLYALTRGNTLKPRHHVRIPADVKADLLMWFELLQCQNLYCRKFIEFGEVTAEEIQMYSDASGNLKHLGFGAFCLNDWMKGYWSDSEITQYEPSIQYLELFAVTAGVLTWIHRFKNKKVRLFCDNDSVVKMINNSSSRCKNCMVLIRLIVLEGMKHNVRIFAKHIESDKNVLSDSLSRMDMTRFWDNAHESMNESMTNIPERIWPASKIWLK